MVEMTSAGRVQSPDLNLTPSLTPAPVTNVVTVRPVNREGAGSNLLNIADSLSRLGAPLNSFVSAYAASAENKQKLQAQADQYLPPEVIQANIANDPAKYGNQYYTSMAGRAAANNLGPLIDQWTTEEWDSSKEDYKTFVARKLSEYQTTLPSDEARAAFGETAGAWVDQAYTKHEALVTETAQVNRDNLIYKDYAGLIERGKLDKKTPDQIWQDIVTASNENRLFLNLPGVNQNAILLSLADKVAEDGDVDMVKAILNGPRGPDGKVPALSTIPDTMPKVEAIIQKAEAKYRENNINGRISAQSELNTLISTGASDDEFKKWAVKYNDTLTPDQVVAGFSQLREGRDKLRMNNQWAADGVAQRQAIDAQLDEALLKGEGWNSFGKVTVNSDSTYGSTVEIDVDKRMDERVNVKVDGVYNSLPQDQADIEVAKFLAANNRTYKGWTAIFAAVTPAAIEAAATEGKMSPQLVRAAELYARTADQYGGVIGAHIKSDAKGTMEFFEAYRINVQELNMDPQEALAIAARNTNGPDSDNRKAISQQEVYRAYENHGRLSSYDLEAAAKIKVMADNLALSANLRGEEALKRAEEMFKKNNVEVLGTWIPKNDPRIPTNVADIAQSYAEDWVTTHGASLNPPITDPEEIGIMWQGGRMVLKRRTYGTPIRMPSGRDQNAEGQGFEIITMQELGDYARIKEMEREGKSRAEVLSAIRNNRGFRADFLHPDKPVTTSSTLGDARTMFGIDKPDEVKTLNEHQLNEIQRAINSGKITGKYTDKAYTDLVAAEIKRRDDEARMKIMAITGVYIP